MRVKVGDVFKVPVSGNGVVYGQVIDKAGPQHLVTIFRSGDGPDDAMRSGIELAGIVFDAKFRNGDWQIVANATP